MKLGTPVRYGLAILFCSCFITCLNAQNPEKKLRVAKDLLGQNPALSDSTFNTDTLSIVSDSLSIISDTTQVKQIPKGDIETTINYSARDSINFSVDTKIVELYGDAKIKYGTIELEADQITIDYNKNTLTAHGQKDSLGRKIGYPIFKNGAEVYETKDITYNFKTGRARISQVVTKQGEGFLHGETVFKNEKNELFSIDNSYTTCNLENPHFRIRSRKTKAIPDDKIVSGPFNLEINNVPTPLGFAFGMFPAKNEASSGLIIPSYGEEQRRGFFLRGGGYFFDISDYIKTTVTGDIYSKGGHGLTVNTLYKKRYAYNGNFNFSYTKVRLSDNIEDVSNQNDYRLTWSHTPQSKGTSRFSASINAATSTFNQNNFIGINGNPNDTRLDNFTRKLSSNINYSKTFPGTPFSLALSARHNQDVGDRANGDGQVDLTLPSLSFNMANIYPLRGKSGSGGSWTDKINLRYTLVGQNQITNNIGRVGSDQTRDSIAPFNFNTLGTYFQNARKGFRHTVPVATSFKLLKYLTASPSFNYEERWYFEQLVYGIDADNPNTAVVVDTINGFNRVYDYSLSTGISTRLYGTYFFKKGKGNIEAIRHVINPNLSFSYQPDFSDEKFGYYQRLTTESGQEILRSRYQGFVYGTPGIGESGSIGLSVTNTLEMKVKSKSDSTDRSKKVPLLNNFGFNTSYNIVADSFKLSNISVRGNTAIFNKKMNINFNGTIDPYTRVLDSTGVNSRDERVFFQRRIDQFAWNNGGGLGQLTSATVAISTNLSPKAREREEKQRDKINNSDLNQADKDFLLNNPDSYVDFEIPWSLRINYSLNYRKTGFEDPEITQTLRFSGDLSLSEQWKITFNSGYDFENKEFTQTNLGITRDLHCWTMGLNWTPFGFFQNYNFTIRVKSSLLQDLKIERNRSFFDR